MAAATVQKGLTPKPLSIWTCRAAPTKAERHAISAISLCFLTHLYGSRSSLLPLAANFFSKTNNSFISIENESLHFSKHILNYSDFFSSMV